MCAPEIRQKLNLISLLNLDNLGYTTGPHVFIAANFEIQVSKLDIAGEPLRSYTSDPLHSL